MISFVEDIGTPAYLVLHDSNPERRLIADAQPLTTPERYKDQELHVVRSMVGSVIDTFVGTTTTVKQIMLTTPKSLSHILSSYSPARRFYHSSAIFKCCC